MFGSTWILFIFLGIITPIVSSIQFGIKEGGGIGGLVGFGVGIIIGIGNYYGFKIVGSNFGRWFLHCKEQRRLKSLSKCLAGLLNGSAMLWIIFSGILGCYFTKLAVHSYKKTQKIVNERQINVDKP